MSPRQEQVLHVLRHHDQWLPAWIIARETGLGVYAVSGALRRLRDLGLVTRTPARWAGRRILVWRFG